MSSGLSTSSRTIEAGCSVTSPTAIWLISLLGRSRLAQRAGGRLSPVYFSARKLGGIWASDIKSRLFQCFRRPSAISYKLFFTTEWEHLYCVVRVVNINNKNSPKWAKHRIEVPRAPR